MQKRPFAAHLQNLLFESVSKIYTLYLIESKKEFPSHYQIQQTNNDNHLKQYNHCSTDLFSVSLLTKPSDLGLNQENNEIDTVYVTKDLLPFVFH